MLSFLGCLEGRTLTGLVLVGLTSLTGFVRRKAEGYLGGGRGFCSESNVFEMGVPLGSAEVSLGGGEVGGVGHAVVLFSELVD